MTPLFKKSPLSFSTPAHLSHHALKTAGEKRSGLAGSSKYLYPPLPNIHSFSINGCGEEKSGSTPIFIPAILYKLHLVQKWGFSIAWPLETLVGERSFEERRGTLDRDDNEPGEGGREEEGWLHVSFSYLSSSSVEQLQGSQLLFSLRIKAPFTGSVTYCVLASCVGHLTHSTGA